MSRKSLQCLLLAVFAGPPLALALGVLLCNWWVLGSTRDRIYASPSDLDAYPVALVLGTSKNVAPDRPNLHFENRLLAASALIESGKVERLLVSGHRDSRYYDETLDMIHRLKELGVPEASIVADDRGARTLDSVRRAKEVFGFDRLVIVSDDFHVGRALFIADRIGLEAVALRSAPVGRNGSRKVRLRECFARVKAVMDVIGLALRAGEGDGAEIAASGIPG